MRASKSGLLIVCVLVSSLLLTGCSGSLGAIFSGLMEGLGNTFANIDWMQFATMVLGATSSQLGQQVASGEGVSDSDFANSMGSNAMNGMWSIIKSEGARNVKKSVRDNYDTYKKENAATEKTETPTTEQKSEPVSTTDNGTGTPPANTTPQEGEGGWTP